MDRDSLPALSLPPSILPLAPQGFGKQLLS